MKLQFFVLGLFAATAIAFVETGSEKKQVDLNDCFQWTCGKECKQHYVAFQKNLRDANGNCYTKCCRSRGDANDEADEEEGKNNNRGQATMHYKKRSPGALRMKRKSRYN